MRALYLSVVKRKVSMKSSVNMKKGTDDEKIDCKKL